MKQQLHLNRTFPGDARGTPTETIAHHIEEVLVPKADDAVDLHSGGTSLIYLPTLTPWQAPHQVSSPLEGMVLCKRALGQAERGDAVYQIAADAGPW